MSDDAPASTTNAGEDWPVKATQTLVGYVDTVRTATTGKALVASRALVYFLAMGLIAIMLLILLLVLLVRVVMSISESILPFIDNGEVWLTYLVLGVVFWIIGGILWKKKGA